MRYDVKGGIRIRRSDLWISIMGIALVAMGLILLLNNLGITRVSLSEIISTYWPLLIVALGLFWVLSPDASEPGEQEIVEEEQEQERSARSDQVANALASEYADRVELGDAEDSSGAQCGQVNEEQNEARQCQLDYEDISEAGHNFDLADAERGNELESNVYGGDDGEAELIKRRTTVGWLVAILGLLILGSSTGRWTLTAGHAGGICWAIVAVLIGLAMVRSSGNPGPEGRANCAVLSRVEYSQPGWTLRSGSYSAIFANALLDLSVASIPETDTYIDITAVFGGVQVILPPELPVKCEGTAVLGSVNAFGHSAGGGLVSRDYVRHGSDDSRSSLKIRCRTIVGSIDIR